MKILFVTYPHSIHAARWITQLAETGWDLHLYPSITEEKIHPLFRNITFHGSSFKLPEGATSVRITNPGVNLPFIGATANRFLTRVRNRINRLRLGYYPHPLRKLIEELKPDLIHALEIQHAGYLTLYIKNQIPEQFPPWIVTNWGSDVYLFGRLAEHRDRVRAVLENCDYYTCECERDIALAKEMGLRGKVMLNVPNSGGFHIEDYRAHQQPGKTSEREIILLKGYQHFAGRALCGLQAIKLCSNIIKERGYRVVIYVATPDVRVAAEILSQESGIPIEIFPFTFDHNEVLQLLGQARVYMGLSIADAVSISALEAITMGTFPIQSSTSCFDEWILDGETGFVVPPEDPHVIAEKLRSALTDDELVDQAAERNRQVVQQRLEYRVIQNKVIDMYKTIYRETQGSQV